MCGRFTFKPSEDFYERFEIVNRLDGLVPRYNIAPGQMVPVIIAQHPKPVVLMRWGLIPHWAKEAKTAYKLINARVETLAQKAMFRGLLRSHRCIVPASGYYEWKTEARGNTPYYIHPRDGDVVAFAGLYDVWTRPNGDELRTFTIITTAADDFMAELHTRMPVILDRELEDDWLDPALTDPTRVIELLTSSLGIPLEAYPVSHLVNAPRHDTEALIQPAE